MSGSSYSWQGLGFDVPEGLADQTVLQFVDDPEAPSFNLGVTTDSYEGDLDAYVTTQVAELGQYLPGYALKQKDKRTVAGAACVVLEQLAQSPEGEQMTQRQAYVKGAGRVVVITATSTAEGAKAASQALEDLLGTLSLKG